jgi:hypothetical protein
MARDGSGNFSLVAGNPVVSGTTITIAWANGTLSDIATAITGSLARDGQGAMTGALNMGAQNITNAAAIAASAAVTAATFVPTSAAAPSNGMYLSGTNTLGFATNGILHASIDPSGNLTATSFIGAVPAAEITGSHTLPDGVLSTNVPLLNQANTFTGVQTINVSGVGLKMKGTTTGAANQAFIQFVDSAGTVLGYIGDSDGAVTDQYFVSVQSGLKFGTNNVVVFSLDVNGAVTTNGASAGEVGTAGAVHRDVAASTNTATTDGGKTIRFTGGVAQTFTLDSDPPQDSVVLLVNKSGNSWTIAASGTLTFAGTTGSRTLATGCMASAFHDGSGNWYISGSLT